jgi:hypothetical protein
MQEQTMEWWILKQLRAQVLTDLKNIIPNNYFDEKPDEISVSDGFANKESLERELCWGYLAIKLGHNLFFNGPTEMSARQVSAAEVLMHLGTLAASEVQQNTTQQLTNRAKSLGVDDGNAEMAFKQLESQVIPNFRKNVDGGLRLYINHLTETESKPFLALLNTKDRAKNFI